MSPNVSPLGLCAHTHTHMHFLVRRDCVELPRVRSPQSVVHYRWKGYRDCIDVDYFPEPVEHIHGVPLESPVWRRIDHCSINRVKQIVTPAFAASNSSTACADYIGQHYWGLGGLRMGINVVPVVNPPNVFPEVEPNIPWSNKMIAGTP